MSKINSDSPCEVTVVPQPDGGVDIQLFVPTYSGGQTFTMSAERDGDGNWRIFLPLWPNEADLHEPAVVAHLGDETVDVCGGIAYVGAPDVEVERTDD